MSFIINPYAFGAPASSLLTGLSEFWPLTEVSGNRTGAHAGIVLTDNNTVSSNTGLGGGVAAQFSQPSQEYLSAASQAALQAGTFDFTFVAWVYRDAPTNPGTIVSKYDVDSALYEYLLLFDVGSNRFTWYVMQPGGAQVSVTANTFGAVPGTSWMMVIAEHVQGSEIRISVNNGTPDTAAVTLGVNATSAQFRIGNWKNAGANWSWFGRLQYVGYWKRLLTSGEKLALLNSGSGKNYPFI